jgi:hypothetical protein
MDLNEIFKCKNITPSTLSLYKSKLRILNNNNDIKDIKFLYDINGIKNKISHLKPNTQRSYIITITSILKCMTNDNNSSKKLIELYNTYSKLLDEYNSDLKDQTNNNTNIISTDKINDIYNNLKINKNKSKQAYQDYLILSLYYLTPPRRNRDYQLLKYVNYYKDTLSNDFNYYDGNNFYFNNYKTKGTYDKQIIEVPLILKDVLNDYIDDMDIFNNDFILFNIKTGEPFKLVNSITVILNRIFKDKIGSSALRRSYLTSKYSNTQNELSNDATAMGTSVNVAQNQYIKKQK